MIRSIATTGILIVAACGRRYETRLAPTCPPAKAQSAFSRSNGRSVYGTVRDRDTGHPLTQASVQLLPEPRNAMTDSVGAFAFQDVADGQYVLRTRRLGYEDRTDTIVVRRGVGTQADLALRSAGVDRCFQVVTVRTPLPWWHIW